QFLCILSRWLDDSRHGPRRKVCKAMSSKRGQGDGNDQSGEQRPDGDPGEDKVIRLPRDWLGPREDLVPFGPSADRHSPEPSESEPPSGERDAPGDASARPSLEEVPSPPPDPVSPD